MTTPPPADPARAAGDPLDAEVAALLEMLAERYGYDLRQYRLESVRRRVLAARARLGAASVSELQARLEADPQLGASVVDQLTVQVSDMFRDALPYRFLREQLVPQLRTYPHIKVWHAGCAGGEEVWSTAILLDEEGLLDRAQIYATDLSAGAVARAREGIYAASRLPQFARGYRQSGGRRALEDHFTVAYDHAAIQGRLRSNVWFFQHDLRGDQVLGEMHLIFCRNVLIYFGQELRERVLDKLTSALARGGFLCLGTSESLGLPIRRSEFRECVAGSRIYRYRGEALTPGAITTPATSTRPEGTPTVKLQAQPMTDDRPSVLLVDDNEDNLVALEALLADLPCELVRAGSGNEALRQLIKRRFAVMLLDVQMPEMDGYEVARYARDSPASREVPIIFLTAASHTEQAVLRGYGSGAVDYLRKPLDPSVLRSKVRVFLELSASRQRLAAALVDLEQARQEAERASRFKSQFLANMSHELRTPLNAIIGFAELLEDPQTGPLSSSQREFVNHISTSGRHLTALMNDILDLARIEAGRIEVRPEPVALAALIKAAQEIVRPMAQKKGVQLTCELPPALPDAVMDPVRIKQVLYNLLSNGIKFTDRGGQVRLRAQLLGGDPAQGLTIAVSDTGIGIRAEDQRRLFREFERIQPTSGPTQEGTGLGLALTKRLVELHGGSIAVDSVPGRGSTFTVSLPLRAPAPPAAEPAAG
jgi:two-component system, sensor histidine kinase and response regulator